MKRTKSSKKKPVAALVPVKMTVTERAAAASKQLANVEVQIAAYRVAALGDQPELTRTPDQGTLSLESMIQDIYTRLEVLARETRRINARMGQ